MSFASLQQHHHSTTTTLKKSKLVSFIQCQSDSQTNTHQAFFFSLLFYSMIFWVNGFFPFIKVSPCCSSPDSLLSFSFSEAPNPLFSRQCKSSDHSPSGFPLNLSFFMPKTWFLNLNLNLIFVSLWSSLFVISFTNWVTSVDFVRYGGLKKFFKLFVIVFGVVYWLCSYLFGTYSSNFWLLIFILVYVSGNWLRCKLTM